MRVVEQAHWIRVSCRRDPSVISVTCSSYKTPPPQDAARGPSMQVSVCLPIVMLLAPCGATLANATDTIASWIPSTAVVGYSTNYSVASLLVTLILVTMVIVCCCRALRRDPDGGPCGDYTGFFSRGRRCPCQCGNPSCPSGSRGCRHCSIRDPQQQLFRCVSVHRSQEPPRCYQDQAGGPPRCYQDQAGGPPRCYQDQAGGPYAVFVGDENAR